MSEPVGITLSSDAVERIAARAAEIVLARLREEPRREGPSWLYGAQQAADYLGWPRKRVYNRLHELPHRRDESRLVFATAELDAFLASTPPGGPGTDALARSSSRLNENEEGVVRRSLPA